MNPKFAKLPREKQERILNASLEAFSRHGYKKAVTTDIAASAGISKGLLFFYFENKQGLYNWLFDCCVKSSLKLLMQEEKWRGMDFFDALEKGLKEKMELARKHPALLGFVMRAWREPDPIISAHMRRFLKYMEGEGIDLLLSWLDTSRFRDGVEPRTTLELLICMSEGFLTRQYRENNFSDVSSLEKAFSEKLRFLRKLVYQ